MSLRHFSNLTTPFLKAILVLLNIRSFKDAFVRAIVESQYELATKRDLTGLENRLIIKLGGLIAIAIGIVAVCSIASSIYITQSSQQSSTRTACNKR